MKYDFDELIDRRNTNAMSMEGFRENILHAGPELLLPYRDEDLIRMWVADMDFATPLEICDALKERVERRIFGYTKIFYDDYYDTLNEWCKKMYDWEFPQEDLVFSNGVIPALYELIGDLVDNDGKILVTTPSYRFFQYAAEFNGAKIVRSPLFKNESGHFTIDFADFEKKAADPQMKLILWCSPHNPTGRMWSKAELEQVAAIAEKYNLWLISDEIHCDLLRQGLKHIPMGKITNYQKLITCMSASKIFNLAGFMFANIIIRDQKIRELFRRNDKNVGFVNPLSVVAQQAAYDRCFDWLDQLKIYLDDNFKYLHAFLKKNLPKATFEIPDATYLAWIDFSAYLDDVDDIPLFFAKNAGVLLEGGNDLFLENANSYVRLNLAMPRSRLITGMERINHAIRVHRVTE